MSSFEVLNYRIKSKSPLFVGMKLPICRRRRIGLLLVVPLLVILFHFNTVTELYRQDLFYKREGKMSRKSDHLILGPAAGQGLSDRIQCQGTRALNKAHMNTTVANSINKVSFVTVFTFYNDTSPPILLPLLSSSSDRVSVANASYDKKERSLAILGAFIDFIQVSMPKSEVLILSDPSSKFPLKRENVFVIPIQGDYSRDRLMLQRIKSYIFFLERRYEEHQERSNDMGLNHYIFTDSDIAIVDDLEPIFQEYPDFDLALTFRNNKKQPLNSGIIAVRGTLDSILKAKVFLESVLEVYTSRYIKASRMLGDQLALAWFVKSHLSLDDATIFKNTSPFSNEINGATVLFLPCLIYNWTPPEGSGQFHGMPLDVKVVHFKGSRKRLMLEAWHFFNSTSKHIPNMLCLILMSGRTKYDF